MSKNRSYARACYRTPLSALYSYVIRDVNGIAPLRLTRLFNLFINFCGATGIRTLDPCLAKAVL